MSFRGIRIIWVCLNSLFDWLDSRSPAPILPSLKELNRLPVNTFSLIALYLLSINNRREKDEKAKRQSHKNLRKPSFLQKQESMFLLFFLDSRLRGNDIFIIFWAKPSESLFHKSLPVFNWISSIITKCLTTSW